MRWALLLACALVVAPLTGGASPDEEEGYEVTWENEPGDESAGDDGNTSAAVEPAQVPGTFDAEETFDETRTYHVRAHAIVGEGEHRWSQDVRIGVTDGDGEDGLEVAITSHPDEGTTEGELTFTWELDGGPDVVDRTQLHWGPNGTEAPSPDAYESTAGTTQNATVPGSYEATLSNVDPGVYHARASATNDGERHWSDEVTFEITEAGDGPENHTVTIESFMFQPSALEVQPGDRIIWENQDGVTHTATFDNETLGDSGDIEPGESYTLTVPEDLEAGTYDYVCDYHATMEASITVVDGDGG